MISGAEVCILRWEWEWDLDSRGSWRAGASCSPVARGVGLGMQNSEFCRWNGS
jgi:hypothetical protein